MKERTLLEDTERLVHGIVRDAHKRRMVRDAEGNPIKGKFVQADFLDRCRAADSAMKFLAIKEKLDPPETESEFQRALAQYHGSGDGDGSPPEKHNGSASASD